MPRFIGSSNIHSADYDSQSRELTMQFVRGGQYTYYEVPQDVYDSLLEAESAGHYFHNYIRDTYRFSPT